MRVENTEISGLHLFRHDDLGRLAAAQLLCIPAELIRRRSVRRQVHVRPLYDVADLNAKMLRVEFKLLDENMMFDGRSCARPGGEYGC